MKSMTLALVATIAAAANNDYFLKWEETKPSCDAAKLCGRREEECKKHHICRVLPFTTLEHCQRIWRYEFCDDCTSQGMVNDPLRWCKCITPLEATAGFCELEDEPDECYCPFIYAPVSCSDGSEHQNACVARCKGQTSCDLMDDIVRPDVCVCSREFAPVRCDLGLFNNQCEANC